MGVESEYAVATPGNAFSAPGPYCIANTPGRRPFVMREKASAMPTPTRSWRHSTGRMPMAAAASMTGVVGYALRKDTASRFRISAIASTIFICRGRIHLAIMRRHAAAVLVLLTLALAMPAVAAAFGGIPSVGITVVDADRSAAFYTGVLGFERVSDVEIAGPGYDALTGLTNVRMRVVTLRLFDERLELTQYLSPAGKPIAAGSRSHDHWFQHIAIIVSDMDRAHRW